MLIDLITIVIFALIGFMFAHVPKTGSFNRLDILLVVLLILAANMHGAFGSLGIGEFKLSTSPILQGIIGGILIKRMFRKVAQRA